MIMEKIELKNVDKTIYREVLDNGLEIIIIPNEKFSKKKNYYFNYGTYYGALNNEFVPKGKNKMTSFPSGIAHFLEHKMFESKDGEKPFDFYARTGSYVNALTSYKNTCYIVTGNKKMKENLEYLLTFVNSPYFTDENVKKEQGIISEEAAMNEDIPDYLAYKTISKNLYKLSPYNTPILGTIESIKSITKEDLYNCYNTFYRPSNMFLVVGGAVSPDEIIKITTDTLKRFSLEKDDNIKVKHYKEPVKVVKEYEEINAPVNIDKLAIGFKMDKDRFPLKNKVILNLYLNMIISLCFGASSSFREMVRKRHLVSRSGYYFQDVDNIITFMVEVDSLNTPVYLKELENYLNNLNIEEEDLERIKKVWISSEVIKTDYADSLVDSVVDDLINYHKVITNYVELIKNMNITTMNEVLRSLDFTNKAIVKVTNKVNSQSKCP